MSYVTKKYGKATVVIDGYDNGPDIKDVTHKRHNHGTGPTVALNLQTVVTLKKKEFLSNRVNKRKFLSVLSSQLEEVGCQHLMQIVMPMC